MALSLCSGLIALDKPADLRLPPNLAWHQDGYIIDAATQEPIKLDPETVSFEWDFDDTLAAPSYLEFASHLLTAKGAQLILYSLAGLLVDNYITQTMRPVKSVTAESYAAAFQDTDPALAAFFLTMGSSINPIPGMENLVEQLKESGYSHYIATNKELMLFEKVYQKPSLQRIFAAIPQALVVCKQQCTPSNPAIKTSEYGKPNQNFFAAFDNAFNDGKMRLFIDDKDKNVIAASKNNNWISIQFKNYEQLIDILAILSIVKKVS